MNNINMFVKLIIALTFVWAIGENMLPDNNIKKYTGYIYGLLLVTCIVSLVVDIKDFDYSFVYSDLEDVSEYNSEYLKSLYEDNLEGILRDKFKDDSINVELSEDYNIESISCENSETYEEIKRYFNE
jgi:hypothetical protein